MPLESWFVLQAAEIAQQTVTHVAVTAAAVQHEAETILHEITQLATNVMQHGPSVNGGCSES